jgi:hypothetical protein
MVAIKTFNMKRYEAETEKGDFAGDISILLHGLL